VTTLWKLLVVLGASAVAACPMSLAQPQGKVWRIGMLETTSIRLNGANLGAFRQGLREAGYVEGQNLIIEYRSADGRGERFAEMANELVALKVDLIVTRGTPAALAAKHASRTIPVVMANAADPVGSGIVATLARPGGNVTGLSTVGSELEAKRLELLRETVPGLARVGALVNMGNASQPPFWQEIESAARRLGIEVQLLDVRKSEDLEPAFAATVKRRVNGLIVTNDGLLTANRKLIAELAAKNRLPTIYQSTDFIEVGGFMAYGPNYRDLYRRASTYVDNIFKGAKPADLPIEQPTKFELIINLKTAKALGLTIPQSILVRANEVIE
jgi:putative ABC transport system substrate-binding protein